MLSILIPTYNQIDQIKSLNSKYLISHLNDLQKQNGFIRIEYNEEDLQKIIANKEIVIATNDSNVVGYYLVGKKSDKPELEFQNNVAIELYESHKIPFEKIGYGCQVCIEQTFRENGLSKSMLNNLIENVREKYTHLLSTISIENKISLKNSSAIGWKPLDVDKTSSFIYTI